MDGLRGVAIVLVLIWHYLGAFRLMRPPDSRLFPYFSLTFSGVDLFFVLSGFLITGILLDARDSPSYYKTFFVRRAGRIYPLYYGFLALFALLHWWQPLDGAGRSLASPGPWLAYVFLVQNFWMGMTNGMGPRPTAVTWSLAIEEQFYLVLPFAVRLLRGRRLFAGLVVVALAAPLARLGLYYYFPAREIPVYVLPFCRAETLCFGAMAAWLWRVPSVARFLTCQRRRLFLPLLLFLPGLIYLSLYSRLYSALMVSVGYTWLAGFYATLLVMAVVHSEGLFAWCLRLPLLQELGRLSYGIYLFHELIQVLVRAFLLEGDPSPDDGEALLVSVCAIVATYLVAKCSWHVFEEPIVRRSQAFRYERKESFHGSNP